jgi:hypothetical protein
VVKLGASPVKFTGSGRKIAASLLRGRLTYAKGLEIKLGAQQTARTPGHRPTLNSKGAEPL